MIIFIRNISTCTNNSTIANAQRDLKELGKCCATVAVAVINFKRNVTELSQKYPDSAKVNRIKAMATTIFMGNNSLAQKINQLRAMAAALMDNTSGTEQFEVSQIVTQDECSFA